MILVDNGGAAPAVSDDPRITVIKADRNVGYGRGHNMALEASFDRSRFHLVANTDITFDEDVLDQLVGVMDADDRIGLCAPGIVYPDGRAQTNARLLPRPGDLLAKRLPFATAGTLRRRERFLLERWDRVEPGNIPFLTGCFMLFRRSVIDCLGGFDPRFFVFGEDTDISRRAHRIAHTVYVPDVRITHMSRTEAQPSLRRAALMMAGYARYFNKWGWVSDPERDMMNRNTLRDLRLDVGR